MMAHLPLRRVNISNFRRLRGSLSLPLDAPIVLIHGPNGTGKTSVLSAIELALTGHVRSLERLDDRYVARLPYYGESFGTVSIQVADIDGNTTVQLPMTVGGNRKQGDPALDQETAQFYSERSYLDQVSLGRLLELYQHSEGNRESSLARFVNELLGLDHLDALREGLFDTTHLARFKKLSGAYTRALDRRSDLEQLLNTQTKDLSEIESAFEQAKVELRNWVDQLGIGVTVGGTSDSLDLLAGTLRELGSKAVSADIEGTLRAMTELRGRLDGLASRQAQGSAERAESDLEEVGRALDLWRQTEEPIIRALDDDAGTFGIVLDGSLNTVDRELNRLDGQLDQHERSTEAALVAAQLVDDAMEAIDQADSKIAASQSRVGSLATALAQLREHIAGSICPVCDRDFAEMLNGDLLTHVGRKIDEITNEGERLGALINERDVLRDQLTIARHEQAEIRSYILNQRERRDAEHRRASVAALKVALVGVAPRVAKGNELMHQYTAAASAASAARGADKEMETVIALLNDLANHLDQPGCSTGEPIDETWRRLDAVARKAQADTNKRRDALGAASGRVDIVAELGRQRQQKIGAIAELAKARQRWEQSIAVADRRRALAKELQAAAESTRASIVERVFTDSLNGVWREVFTRLAPTEPFVPAFSVPEPNKHGLRLGIETIHRRTGESSGRPEMMLSAGNLNTAALSLFLALHLAVEPEFPCLVFDDPIQSMDEVHISQFAALLRVLSKRHGRQIVLAVHERELFRYLSLELSPAFEGDELITIELSADDDGGTRACDTRLVWRPDDAVAGA